MDTTRTSASEPSLLPSPAERRERNREEVRAAILAAACAVMREQGVAALSLREVARRVRMQAPSLYPYFPGKMALYDALFLMGFRRFMSYREHHDKPLDDFWVRLHADFETYMRFAQENPELYQLLFERPVPGFVPSEETMAEIHQELAKYEQVLPAAVAAGQIALDVPTSQARDLIIAMTHGLTSQHMANEPHLAVGSGRYGGLIPAAVAHFRAAWEPRQTDLSGDDSGNFGRRRNTRKEVHARSSHAEV